MSPNLSSQSCDSAILARAGVSYLKSGPGAWMLLGLCLLVQAGLAQTGLAQVGVWLEDVDLSQVEGQSLSFKVHRQHRPVSESATFVVKITPDDPIAGFTILEGGDPRTGLTKNVTLALGELSSERIDIPTIDNEIVNEDVDLTITIEPPTGYAVVEDDSTRPSSLAARVGNGGDYYQLGVMLPPNWTQTSITEGESVDILFMNCVGTRTDGQVAAELQTCEDATTPRAGAVPPDEKTYPLYTSSRGNFGVSLPTTAVIPEGEFTARHRLHSQDDSIREDWGRVVIQSRKSSHSSRRVIWVNILDDDKARVSLVADPASVTEGGDVVVKAVREDTETLPSDESITVDIGFHTKMFAADAGPPTSGEVTFEEGEREVEVLRHSTQNDALNEGDGMVRVDLDDLGPFRAGTRSTWVRVVDDDIPEVTLSAPETEVVDEEGLEWHLERSCCTEERAYFAYDAITVQRYPQHLGGTLRSRFGSEFPTFGFAASIEAGNSLEVHRELEGVDWVAPLGGYIERRILPFPAATVDDLRGIPVTNDSTFDPRYTVTSSDWVRIDIVNTVEGVEIEPVAGAVDEGEAARFTVRRYGGSDSQKALEKRVQLRVEQEGDHLAAEDLGERTLTVPANVSEATLSINTIDDSVDNPDGAVRVTLLPGMATGESRDSYQISDGASTLNDGLTHVSSVTIRDNEDTPNLTVADASGAEGAEIDIKFTLALDTPATRVASVDFATSNGTATADADYTARTGTVSFGAGEDTKTVAVELLDDAIVEADETFTLTLSNPSWLVIGDSSAEGTIGDDETPGIELSRSRLEVGEGESNAYTVVLAKEPHENVTIDLEGPSGALISFTDQLTFTPDNWDTPQEVRVTAAEDADTEDESYIISHSASGSRYDEAAEKEITIQVEDDETASTGVALSASPDAVGEGDGATPVEVTARLNGGTRSADTPVAVSVGSGTAVSGTDFAAVEGFTITIAAGSLENTSSFTLTPTDDSIDEADETVSVTGTTTVTGLAVAGGEVGIADNDATPTVTLALSDASIGEDGGVAEVTAILGGASGEETTITVSAAPVPPAVAGDYSLSENTTLTIAAGQTESTGTVTLAAVDNDVDAADKAVTVSGAAGNDIGVAGPADVALTIEDDDERGVTVSETELGIDEGGTGTYTVVLDSEPTASVTVTPSRSSGSGDVTVSGALTFTAANWDTAQTVTVGAAEDGDAEDDTAAIGHSVSGGDYDSETAASVNVTVDDDEAASTGVTLSLSPDAVGEGDGATPVEVTARLNGGTRSADTPVSVSVGSGTAVSGTDFAAVEGFTITIAAGSLENTSSFTLTPTDDSIDEADETVSVTGTTTVTGLAVAGGEVGIADNDATPTVTLALSDASINEDGGVAEVTAILSGASGEETRITVSVAPVSPAVAGDYSLGESTTLTIAAGQTASTGTVTVTAVDNDVDDENKAVTVSGAAGNDIGVAGPADVALTIEDDDERGVTVSETELGIDEGGTGTYTVVLDSEPTASVTVTPSRSSGSGDVTVSGALTFTAANWDTAQTVTVGAAEDGDAEDDTAAIGHSVSGGDYDSETAPSVDVTVDDDETPSSGVTLSLSPDAVGEGDGATPVEVTARLNGGTRSADTPVSVSVGSGTAVSGTDFAAVEGFTITIAAGSLENTGSFTLTPTDDSLDENDETVGVTGTTTVTGLAVAGGEVGIADNDATPTVTLALSDASINEDGGVAEVTAILSGASGEETRITVSVAPVSPAVAGDYSLGESTTLTIAAGQTASTGTVTVTAVDNDVDDENKAVTVSGAAGNDIGVAGPADVTLTMVDDDTRGVTVSATELHIDEGGSGTYTIVLDSEPTESVTVTPSRASGDADVSVSAALTFTAANWDAEQTVTVGAAEDGDAEDDTAVIGHSVSGGDYGSTTAASVRVTVEDDDAASTGVSLTVSPDRVGEGDGATTVTVTARLDGGTRSSNTPVAVSVQSGTAESGTDFAAVPGFTINIEADSLSGAASFTLTPIDDSIDETDETLEVVGTTTVPGLSVGSADITIGDADDTPVVSLLLSVPSIGEDGGVAEVTASLSGASGAATTIRVSAGAESLAAAGGYSLSANKLLTIAAGETHSTRTVSIAAVNNDVDAEDRLVTISGSAENPVGVTGPADVTFTIVDDDERGVTVSATELHIDEGGSGTYTIVLDSEPTASVTVTPSRSSGSGDVTVSGPLTFTAANWDAEQTVTVGAAEDGDAEDDTAAIGHSVSGGDYASETAASVDVTVDDDETPSSGVTLTASPDAVGEGDGATPVEVTARLNGGTRSADTPVSVSVGSGTAVSGTDFAAVEGFTITIAAGSLESASSFTLTPTDDPLDEANETLELAGSAKVPGLSVNPADVVILDDDPTPTITLVLSESTMSEDGGVAEVKASLSYPSSEETRVMVSVEPMAPAKADDYALSGNSVLTIPPGETISTSVVSITTLDNDLDELDKMLMVSGSAVKGLGVTDPPTVTVMIEDDDDEAANGVTLAVSPAPIGEGDGATLVTVTASLDSGVRDAETRVSVTVDSGTAVSGTDFEPVEDFTITIAAGSRSNTASFTLTPTDDDMDEPDETLEVSGATTLADFEVSGTRIDLGDDDAIPMVTLALSESLIGEDGGTAAVTASLSHPSSEATVVTVSAMPVPPALAGDYRLGADRVLIIEAGSTASTGGVTITGIDNAVAAGDRSVVVSGAAENGLGVTGPPDVTLTIGDDDARGVTVSTEALGIEEGGFGVYTLVLNSEPSGPVTVTPSRSSGDTDVTLSEALTFTSENWNLPQEVTVGAAKDEDADDDSVVIAHTVAGGDYGTVSAAPVTVTVRDTWSNLPVSLSLSMDRLSVPEGAGPTGQDVTVTASLDHARHTTELEVTLSVVAGSAREVEDFQPVEQRVLRIAAGEASGSARLTIVPVDDAIDEADESLVLRATPSMPNVQLDPDSNLELVIADDDVRAIVIDPTELNLPGGGTATYRVVLGSQPTDRVTIGISGHAGTPVAVDPARLEFSAEDWSSPKAVVVVAEPRESVVALEHSVSGGDYDSMLAESVRVVVGQRGDDLAAAEGALTQTGRMLLNSVSGVIDNRRREAAAGDPPAPEEPLAKRIGATLRALTRMEGGSVLDTGPSMDAGRSAIEPAIGTNLGAVGQAVADSMPPHGGRPGNEDRAASGSGAGFDWQRMLWGRSFSMSLDSANGDGADADDAPLWTLWGAADLRNLEGNPKDGRFDGDLRSVFLGVDRRLGSHWLAGVSVSRAEGDVEYEYNNRSARLDSKLTSLYPYAIGNWSGNLEVWMVGGVGRGDARAGWAESGASESGDLGMDLASAGFSLGLAQFGRTRLSMIGDAGQVNMELENGEDLLRRLETSVRRLRLGVEGQMKFENLQPFWQLSARSDGGDGPNGTGADLLAGLRYETPRVKFSAQGRWFTIGSLEGHREVSAMASLSVSAAEDKSGLTLALTPRWGQAGTSSLGGAGGSMMLWDDGKPTFGWNESLGDAQAWSYDGEIGYGFLLPRTGALLTPSFSMRQGTGGVREMLVGLLYASMDDATQRNLNLKLLLGHGSGPRDEAVVSLGISSRF